MSELPNTIRVIGDEWKQRSRELAEWGIEHLVNRGDVWGQYTTQTAQEKLTSKRSYKALTLPQKKMRGKDMVTLEKLTRHFGSLRRNHLIGLHAASTENTSKWLAIDIDLHDLEAVDAEDGARRNFAAAVGWWEALQARGYDPLLFDSNGAGGYHIWVLFADPVPTEDVYAMAQETIADWQSRNLDAAPETFPKSARPVEGEKLGAWLRLPGLHHTHDHFTRVWSGEAWLDEPWQEGSVAIDAILQTALGAAPRPADGSEPVVAKGAQKRSFDAPKRESSVCVDLDGVLASFDGWRGAEHFGDPIGGAVEFTRTLSEFARVVVFTARLQDAGDEIYERVKGWLDANGFAYDEIYRGEGKPLASAYVDDRAVSCLPQLLGIAGFAAAEARVREMCGERIDSEADLLFAELAEIWPGLTPKQQQAVLDGARSKPQ